MFRVSWQEQKSNGGQNGQSHGQSLICCHLLAGKSFFLEVGHLWMTHLANSRITNLHSALTLNFDKKKKDQTQSHVTEYPDFT